MKMQSSWDDDSAWAMLAQAVINITEGLTSIESGSPIHEAMKYLLEHRREALAKKEKEN